MNKASQPVIAYVVKMFPRLSETFIRNEIAELERQGLTLRIFSLKRPLKAAEPQTNGQVRCPIVYLPERLFQEPLRVLAAQCGVLLRYPRGFLRTLAHVLRGRELWRLPRALRCFGQACCLVHELEGAQHLHAHFANDPTRLACWARMICGISYSVTTHAKDLFQDNRFSSPALRRKLNAANFVVANSRYSTDALLLSSNGAPQNEVTTRIVTIYNGIDLTAFGLRRQASKEPVILSVGRLVEKKGFQQLIQACARLKERRVRFHCEIVGSGRLKAVLEQEIVRLHLENWVRLRGERSHDELLPFYERAMVFALPCVVAADGDRDILPNVLKEAMAVGVPVVTTQLEGIGELVTHGQSGLVVPPNDTEALAEALRVLLTDPALRDRLAAQARQVIEKRFDAHHSFCALKDLLTTVAQSPCQRNGRPAAPVTI